MIFVIVRNNYVVDRIVADADFVYPHPHDLMVHDTDQVVYIGDWYEADEGIFYRPVNGTPPDWPAELVPPSEEE